MSPIEIERAPLFSLQPDEDFLQKHYSGYVYRCLKCKLLKPLTEFWFKSSGQFDYFTQQQMWTLRPHCKECHNQLKADVVLPGEQPEQLEQPQEPTGPNLDAVVEMLAIKAYLETGKCLGAYIDSNLDPLNTDEALSILRIMMEF